MKMKHWAMQYDHCKACGTTDIPHHGNGLCNRCYHREYKQNPPQTDTTRLKRERDELDRLATVFLQVLQHAYTFIDSVVQFNEYNGNRSPDKVLELYEELANAIRIGKERE
jgi:uncharacterized Zn finger protein (UPF0148 family)